jgi:hypothetical protein
MGEIIDLHDRTIALAAGDIDLIADLARFAEGLVNEQSIRGKYQERYGDAVWDSLGDPAIIKAIDLESQRRIRDGSAAREKAQQLFAGAPTVLGEILNGDGVSPRHKIESARELRTIAANGPESTPAEARFVIRIDLSADTHGDKVIENYSKAIKIDPLDNDPFNPTPPEVLAAIAAKKNESDGGEHL